MSIFDQANKPAGEGLEWFKFQKIGDKIGGKITAIFYTTAKEFNGIMFPEQRSFTLECEDGVTRNVGRPFNKYTNERTDMLQVGDEVGFEYEKDGLTNGKKFKGITIYTKLNGDRTAENAAKLAPSKKAADEVAF